jgi:hypothetical protein
MSQRRKPRIYIYIYIKKKTKEQMQKHCWLWQRTPKKEEANLWKLWIPETERGLRAVAGKLDRVSRGMQLQQFRRWKPSISFEEEKEEEEVMRKRSYQEHE